MNTTCRTHRKRLFSLTPYLRERWFPILFRRQIELSAWFLLGLYTHVLQSALSSCRILRIKEHDRRPVSVPAR